MDPSLHDAAGQHALLVPAQNVKAVKTFLEERRLLDKSRKITPFVQPSSESETLVPGLASHPGKRFIIPLLPEGPDSNHDIHDADELDLETHLGTFSSALESQIGPEAYKSISVIHLSNPETPSTKPPTGNPLRAAFHAALSALPPTTLTSLHLSSSQLAASLPATYSIYPPLLLLAAHTFHAPAWTTYLAAHPLPSAPTQTLLSHVACALGVTHIATNAPIAPRNAPSSADANGVDDDDGQGAQNILRSPTHLAPLFGPFPPRLADRLPPTPHDLAAALWVHARQNGIAQTWAPAYTMFSRGNVKEKARVLGLASVATAVREGREGGRGCAAVDLYAGIGYFAFSYRRAGVARVLGWEINAWSVEGLRRGAGENGWGVGVVDGAAEKTTTDLVEQLVGEKEVVVFAEGNERAAGRVEGLRGVLPPVRHVNAGLLPSSRGGWETAVRVLDPEMGGWVHLHENFGVGEVGRRAAEVVEEVRGVWGRVRAERGGGDGVGLEGVRLEHVERVKTYAPGVLHCVLDIWVAPTK